MRCEIISRSLFGLILVELYTGEQVTGKARPGLFGLLIDAV
jgi:hypothetical protein